MQRIRCAIVYTLAGSPGLMTMYGNTAAGENGTTAQTLTDRMKAAITAGKQMFQGTVSFQSESFVDTINANDGSITASNGVTGFTVTGGGGSSFAPPAIALCSTWRTAGIVNSRRVRGRTFSSPLDGGLIQTDGTPSATALSYQALFEAAWWPAGVTGTYTVVWHRPQGGTGGVTFPIIGASHLDKFAVLRSRRD